MERRRLIRRHRGVYFLFTPIRLGLLMLYIVGMPIGVYLGHAVEVRIASSAILAVSAVAALWAYRNMRPSRYEAPALQEIHATAPMTYFMTALAAGALTFLRSNPPPGDVIYSLVYVVYGWFVGGITVNCLGVWLLWRANWLNLYVVRSPYWLQWLRGRVPGIKDLDFYEDEK